MKVSEVKEGFEFWIGEARVVICRTGRRQTRIGVDAPKHIPISNATPSTPFSPVKFGRHRGIMPSPRP